MKRANADTDVVVIDGEAITIYGYPEDVFPPTDYATATQVGDEIWIIGNLGYQEHRCDGPAQVRVLNIQDWSIRTEHCTGDDPGSIWGHRCELSSDGRQLLISGGQRHCELVADAIPDNNLLHGTLIQGTNAAEGHGCTSIPQSLATSTATR